jgi:hypothetical protein
MRKRFAAILRRDLNTTRHRSPAIRRVRTKHPRQAAKADPIVRKEPGPMTIDP